VNSLTIGIFSPCLDKATLTCITCHTSTYKAQLRISCLKCAFMAPYVSLVPLCMLLCFNFTFALLSRLSSKTPVLSSDDLLVCIPLHFHLQYNLQYCICLLIYFHKYFLLNFHFSSTPGNYYIYTEIREIFTC
jgi:hypothetical protein